MKIIKSIFLATVLCFMGLLFLNCSPASVTSSSPITEFGGEPYPGTPERGHFVVEGEICPDGKFAFEIVDTGTNPTEPELVQTKDQCNVASRPVILTPADWIEPQVKFIFEGRIYVYRAPGL